MFFLKWGMCTGLKQSPKVFYGDVAENRKCQNPLKIKHTYLHTKQDLTFLSYCAYVNSQTRFLLGKKGRFRVGQRRSFTSPILSEYLIMWMNVFMYFLYTFKK